MLISILLANIWQTLEIWSEGFYYDGSQCVQWHDSCLTCSNQNSCTQWTTYMYLNSTTGLWQYWSYGWYYDMTSELCRDCNGKCIGECEYQALWFQWNSGKVYDTELRKCVDTWTSPKILHTSSQYSIVAVWRSTSIYIDPECLNIIELGTMNYPYKSSISAFSEILNQYSHSNNSISIYIKENTQLIIPNDIVYLINITSVSISSYSSSSSVPNSANILVTINEDILEIILKS